ncbi:MAG: ABC transporter permease, partial [Candidatus Sumerlaeota bacterium]
FGALSVVLLSALGGIMVPLFAMPRLLRQLAVVSPLNWGHQALVKILVDEAAWAQVFWPAARLLIFSIASLALAVAYQKRRRA